MSCKDLVSVDLPRNRIVSSAVYLDDKTANSSVVGIYSEIMGDMNSGFNGGGSGITAITGTSSDEFVNYAGTADRIEFYENTVTGTNSILKTAFWDTGYKYIYYSNAILEQLERSTALTQETKNQIEGEARFIRAFTYFYLVNLFGDIPLITGTDYRINRKAFKSKKDRVYNLIITDLLTAQDILKESYYTSGRVRANKWAAAALLARVYLYNEDWLKAEQQSSLVIGNKELYKLEDDLGTVFLNTSNEAIFQLLPVIPGLNTYEGQTFIIRTSLANVALSSNLENAFSDGDKRKKGWIGNATIAGERYSFPYKYKIDAGTQVTENYCLLRLAEVYLIRAEARAHSGNFDGSREDLNMIRNRAGLSDTKAKDKFSLLNAIEEERRLELFAEWGHRWFDLKRTNRADAILKPLKGQGWSSNSVLYPIPQQEIILNPNLENYEK